VTIRLKGMMPDGKPYTIEALSSDPTRDRGSTNNHHQRLPNDGQYEVVSNARSQSLLRRGIYVADNPGSIDLEHSTVRNAG